MKNRIVLLKKIMRIGYKTFYFFSCLWMSIFWILGKIMRQRDLVLNFLLPIGEAAEKMSNCYVTCKFRPKKSSEVFHNIYCSGNHSVKLGIILQGPIITKNNFTIETIKIYRKIFPHVMIIVSTWEGGGQEIKKEIQMIDNVELIESKQPKHAGNLNLNYQCISTQAGLKTAKKNNIDFVLKTRSDMRIMHPGIIDELHNLVKQYSCGNDNILKQKYRLIVFNAYVFRPYNFSDFYVFGHINDMINYWNTTYQNCSSDSGYIIANRMDSEGWSYKKVLDSKLAPEIEITRDYVERTIGTDKMSSNLEFYWEVIKSNFITLPHSFLDVLWYKYDYNREENYIQKTYIRNVYGGERENMLYFNYSMWIDLLNDEFGLHSEEYLEMIEEKA